MDPVGGQWILVTLRLHFEAEYNKYCNTIPNCSKMHFVFMRSFIVEKGDIVEEEERKRNREGGGGIDSCIRRGREGEECTYLCGVSESHCSYSTYLMSSII